ncbi:ABC transporter ATP-binding protein [Plectonema radiosum NIES-515]|uniref:ABC transporter ATP-binding protein n=1 Tax=Plectonema radiosum NIES-515 TaxID=2986073 RepID=A0ABT3AZU2_9CYAN|nr:ABC transporter ATP-binding protein [Plectonema radiosum]MCV3214643.1 ABC transporter ATP-binding protein [Plectonema radiosum NIES-515]
MSDTIIRVENLSKTYILQHQEGGNSYKALRDVIANGAKSIGRKLRHSSESKFNPTREEFWALKDVSFEIKQGDRVGIIGRNGAGKSTLLKILSRITEPSRGRIAIKGRVASLLEVGTGFHPELTGRENIYLNGAILGMSKAEIKKKFDEIVAFAEVEKFLDTPVKRYSSGMYVRLAFAVAAHLEPEILIVDEVLAVGDTQFQKKCLGKMEDVGKEGRTVLFVSHNMGTITQLCTKAIYLNQGQIKYVGDVNSIVSKYLTSDSDNNAYKKLSPSRNKPIFFKEFSVSNHEGKISSEIDVRYPFQINLSYEVTDRLQNAEISLRIETDDVRAVFTTNQSDCHPNICHERNPGIYEASIEIPAMFLMPGSYFITIGAHQPMVQIFELHEHILSFNINETGTRLAKYDKHNSMGVVIVDLPWKEHHLVTT